MKTLVLGASGATGRHVVQCLLENQMPAKVVIRPHSSFPEELRRDERVETIVGEIDTFSAEERKALLGGCDSVICCLGHNMTWKGLFGKPRYLVSNAVRRIAQTASQREGGRLRFVLMSTTAFSNTAGGEKGSVAERALLSLLYALLPPHRDNVLAANHLLELPAECPMEWVAVRPDTLTNEANPGDYEVTASPARSPVFNAGRTSRANTSHFMVHLLKDRELWNRWKSKMPVIYNQ